MKNVTISMDEATLGWVRVEAAKARLSVSRWVAERLRELMTSGTANDEDVRAMEQFLAHGGWELGGVSPAVDREEIYGERLRGLERRRLRDGSERRVQTNHLSGVAEPALRLEGDEPKRPGGE